MSRDSLGAVQIFFPSKGHEQAHLLYTEDFWRCWLLFTAEKGTSDVDVSGLGFRV